MVETAGQAASSQEKRGNSRKIGEIQGQEQNMLKIHVGSGWRVSPLQPVSPLITTKTLGKIQKATP